MYKLIKRENHARRGELQTVHGTVQTPAFMNVATAAAIKGAVSAYDLKDIKCQVMLSNTYHLHLRPKDVVKDKNALFISNRGTRISPKTVQAMVNKYLTKIGLGGAGYSVHKLRHTAATLMYQYGNVDIRVLQDILGHENLGTTEIYTHTSSKQMEEAVNANPLSKMREKTDKNEK